MKFLRVSTDFVHPCRCAEGTETDFHAYCLTAKIIKTQRIYCDKCNQFYKLYVKQEKICTGKFVQTLTKYACLFFVIIFFAAFFLALDSYLKSGQ